jgi:hypothetical protein
MIDEGSIINAPNLGDMRRKILYINNFVDYKKKIKSMKSQ